MHDVFAPTLAAAQARIAAVQPAAYARTRNALGGAVSCLSPYITHGFVSLSDVLVGVNGKHPLDMQHKFVFELGWRAYFRHVWQHQGDRILYSLRDGPLPDNVYAKELPADIRQACTGVPVIDQAVRTLYATGMLHNHARMWLASYVVHVRKVHWRAGADWLVGTCSTVIWPATTSAGSGWRARAAANPTFLMPTTWRVMRPCPGTAPAA